MYINKTTPKYVYLITECSYGHDGYMKIGISYDYEKRAKQLERNAPFDVRVSLVVTDSNPERLESAALHNFRANRIKGEWFCAMPSADIDCVSCTYREFMDDFGRQCKDLEKRIRHYLISECDGEVAYGG